MLFLLPRRRRACFSVSCSMVFWAGCMEAGLSIMSSCTSSISRFDTPRCPVRDLAEARRDGGSRKLVCHGRMEVNAARVPRR